jgi:diacylglycerol kinase family enzyme
MPPPHWRLILNGKSAGDDALRDAVSTMRQRGSLHDGRLTSQEGDAERNVS